MFVFCHDAGMRRAAELERLQEEVNAQEDFIEVVVAATFGFPDVPEDKDNMSIEILAEVHCAMRRPVRVAPALCAGQHVRCAGQQARPATRSWPADCEQNLACVRVLPCEPRCFGWKGSTIRP